MTVDYRSFGTGAQAQPNQAFNKFWWTIADEKEMANAIQTTIETIAKNDSARIQRYNTAARLYGNSDLSGMFGISGSRAIATQSGGLRDRISYNVIKSAIDTITAKIAKNRPKPLFLTSGGNWKMKRKAQKLTKFIDGVFYENGIRQSSPMAFRDACILGDGLTHVFPHNGRVKFERVLPGELYVDLVDAFYGNPRQLHRVKPVDRAIVLEAYCGDEVDLPQEKKDANRIAIMTAKAASPNLTGNAQVVSDLIGLAESWHLRSSKESKDGKHVISIDGHSLFTEEWKHDRYPFAKLPWCRRLEGFWSQSLSEEIQPIQLEINKLLWIIQRSMHLMGTFKIWMSNASRIVKEHLSNDIGAIITGDVPPQYLTPPIVPGEIYSHLDRLVQRAFEGAGISQLSANAQKPAGLNSGKALREYNDIETERFMTVGHAYEDYHLDLASLSVMVAKDIYEDDKKFSVNVPGKKFLETILWKEVDLEESDFILKMFPISSLPSDPEGRLQTVQEYAQAGYYSQRTAKRLLDFPDTETIDDLESAEEDYLHKILEDLVDSEGEKFTAPDPDDNIPLALELVNEYIAQGKRDNLPSEVMEKLRLFKTQVNDLIQLATPPPPPPGMPGAPAGTQAVPMPPPQSELLPNGAGA